MFYLKLVQNASGVEESNSLQAETFCKIAEILRVVQIDLLIIIGFARNSKTRKSARRIWCETSFIPYSNIVAAKA